MFKEKWVVAVLVCEGTCGFENVISPGKLIANESDEGKRQFHEAALHRAYAV